jgi:hypothetical protein
MSIFLLGWKSKLTMESLKGFLSDRFNVLHDKLNAVHSGEGEATKREKLKKVRRLTSDSSSQLINLSKAMFKALRDQTARENVIIIHIMMTH